MSIREDGRTAGPSARRWRRDDQISRPSNDHLPPARGSGRRAVLAIVVTILALWLGLHLAFRGWKARYLARAEFGATRVATVIDPLASTLPPDLDPTAWRVAVADTHAMLVALTSAGVLDELQMDDLRRDIAARVAGARPETARKTLSNLWDDLERKAGPVIAPDPKDPPTSSRQAARNPHPARPKVLGPSPKPR